MPNYKFGVRRAFKKILRLTLCIFDPLRRFNLMTKALRGIPSGFTLIELMVVVAILGLLAVAGISSFSGAQKNVRDAKRRADIDSIADAMEANYGKFSSANYTACSPSSGCNPAFKYAGLCEYQLDVSEAPQYNCSSSTKPWFAPQSGSPNGKLPQDPDSSKSYYWCPGLPCAPTDGTQLAAGEPPAATITWYICASLENSTSSYYCRNNRQE